MQKLCLGLLLSYMFFVRSIGLGSELPSFPRLFSSDTGNFYARSIPDSKRTYTDGVTKVYRSKDDKLLCEYPWYSRYLWLFFDGSNLTVIRRGPPHRMAEAPEQALELGFYRDGKTIKECMASEFGETREIRARIRGYYTMVHDVKGVVCGEKVNYFEITARDGRNLKFNLSDGQLMADDPAAKPSVSLANDGPSESLVFSGTLGICYAKSIPQSEDNQTTGITRVYRSKDDRLLCEYPWYCRQLWLFPGFNGETLVRYNGRHKGSEGAETEIEIGLYKDGKILKEYTVADIMKTGVTRAEDAGGYRVTRPKGYVCEEKGYYFAITTMNGRDLKFNLNDGQMATDAPMPPASEAKSSK